MRWKLLMEEYDYTVEFIKGRSNCVADCLSRPFNVNMMESSDEFTGFDDSELFPGFPAENNANNANDNANNNDEYDDIDNNDLLRFHNNEAPPSYGSKLDIAGPSWREISWEERMDDESDSYIELEGSILSVKDLRSENELEIVVYSPSDDKSAQSDNSRSNSSGNEQTLRYVSIPRQKIQDFLTKGIGVKNQSFIEDNDANKVKQISVKRKP
ncbi:uncharacterized protein LOC120350108 [Nilaparvata lugens]|uniref:uncharacterized protein LOC120350108 n=1 Tax=Nilaparvata lugens TaxID=108931 RepID=UPI00193CA015|nr:uncharacterized protein LOC120350108 [Nilaparvata lugens]